MIPAAIIYTREGNHSYLHIASPAEDKRQDRSMLAHTEMKILCDHFL